MKTKINYLLLLGIVSLQFMSIASQAQTTKRKDGFWAWNTQWADAKTNDFKQKRTMGYLACWNANNTEKHVVICAHRGMHDGFGKFIKDDTYYFPENTLAAIKEADRRHAPMVEVDIKLSYDDVPVLSHDWTIGRLTNRDFNPYDPPKKGKPGNRYVNYYRASQLKGKPCNVWLRGDDDNNFRKLAAGSYPRYYNASDYNMCTLDDVLKYVIKAKSHMVIALDIKSVAAGKRCLDIVRNNKAWNWVIFKFNADAIYDKKPPKGKSAVWRFEQAMKFQKWKSPYTILGLPIYYFEIERVNIVPMFTTNQAYKIPFSTANKLFKSRPWFFTEEVDVKQGGYGEDRSNPNRAKYADIADLASQSYKLGIFNAVPDARTPYAYGKAAYPGKYFDGSDGHCCYTLDNKLVQQKESRRSKQTGKIVWDGSDFRAEFDFLTKALINPDVTWGWKFRWITTDAYEGLRNFLNLKNIPIVETYSSGGVAMAKDVFAQDSTAPIAAQHTETQTATSNTTAAPINKAITGVTTVTDASYYYEIPKINCNTQLSGAGKKIVCNTYTKALIGMNNSIYTWNDESNNWETNNIGWASDIALQNDGTIWHVGGDNGIYKATDNTNTAYEKLPGGAYKIAIGGVADNRKIANLETVAVIGMNNAIYEYTYDANYWRIINGTSAKEIAIDNMGVIWYIGMNNLVYRIDGDDVSQHPGGAGKKIACAEDGSVLLIGMDDNLYGYNRTINSWQMCNYTNEKYAEIAIVDGAHTLAVKTNNQIWELNDCSTPPNPYPIPVVNCGAQLPGAGKKMVCNGNIKALIGMNNAIYTWDDNTNNWQTNNIGWAADIAVQQDGTIWHVGGDNGIYKATDNTNIAYEKIPGGAYKIAIGGRNTDAETIVHIGGGNNIYTYNHDANNWSHVNGAYAKEIAVDNEGVIWYIGMNDLVYRIDENGASQHPGGAGKKIACGSDGSVLLIGMDGNLYGYNRTINSWQMSNYTNEKYAEIAIRDGGQTYAIKTNNEIWGLADCSTPPNPYPIPVVNCGAQLPGAGKKMVCNDNTKALIGMNNAIYTWDDNTNNWQTNNIGWAADIAVEQDGTIWHVGGDNGIYRGTDNTNTAYEKIPGGAYKIAIGGGGPNANDYSETIVHIGGGNTIYTYNHDANNWSLVNGAYAKEIAVDYEGVIWYIGMNNLVYRIDQNGASQHPGGAGKKIACGSDGSVLLIGMDGNLYGYNRTINTWQMSNFTYEKYAEIASLHGGQTYAIKTDNSIWSLADCNNTANTAAATIPTNTAAPTDNANKIATIKVFPNPAHDKVTVQLAAGMENATVTIISTLGNTIATDNKSGLQRIINVSGTPKGIYLVRVTTKEGVNSTQKLTIQ